ncbi:hypothetical protein [Roseomonas populi]|uniref:Uncharacterized protein n=1 Tax=Roseomonas populi TaxID=3121582 RepID=A0ABT1X5F4_9PROT|nr:hypothetical protein [Roseomonas pecuniae]MCR0982189.1 hypothetical protein [Roseomonas pecuniae]
MSYRPANRPGQSVASDPFDLWLRRSLHETWDNALHERVPDDLLRLFSDDRVEWEAMKTRWLATAPRQGS